ncbi:MAG: hypothetical protein J5546_06565 [Lachnospiraceae bacterium]|nr:hypothetical protein [Lachnospiraceae bacterium]
MAEIKIPVFESGCVLTREMLDLMENMTLDLSSLLLDGFSDGIVSGCGVSMQNGIISIARGIVKIKDHVLFIPGGLEVGVTAGNEWHVLQLRFGTPYREDNFLVRKVTLELSNDLSGGEDVIEVCRFRLQGGAQLRNQYRDYQDLNTEYDTVNEIYAKWSGYGKASVSNRVLEGFAKEAIRRGIQNPQDESFVQMVLNLNGRSMARDSIQFYISSRLSRPYKDLTNMEIYVGLGEVLRQLRSTKEHVPGRQRDDRRIIVD